MAHKGGTSDLASKISNKPPAPPKTPNHSRNRHGTPPPPSRGDLAAPSDGLSDAIDYSSPPLLLPDERESLGKSYKKKYAQVRDELQKKKNEHTKLSEKNPNSDKQLAQKIRFLDDDIEELEKQLQAREEDLVRMFGRKEAEKIFKQSSLRLKAAGLFSVPRRDNRSSFSSGYYGSNDRSLEDIADSLYDNVDQLMDYVQQQNDIIDDQSEQIAQLEREILYGDYSRRSYRRNGRRGGVQWS